MVVTVITTIRRVKRIANIGVTGKTMIVERLKTSTGPKQVDKTTSRRTV